MWRLCLIVTLWFLFSPPVRAEQAVACTEEAMLCPDGSSVGRTGPNCEFAPCPGEAVPQPLPEETQVMCTMDAKICPDGTGVGRTGPNCEFAPCPGEELDKPFQDQK